MQYLRFGSSSEIRADLYQQIRGADKGFAGHGKQATIRVRRFGRSAISYVGGAEPVLAGR